MRLEPTEQRRLDFPAVLAAQTDELRIARFLHAFTCALESAEPNQSAGTGQPPAVGLRFCDSRPAGSRSRHDNVPVQLAMSDAVFLISVDQEDPAQKRPLIARHQSLGLSMLLLNGLRLAQPLLGRA